MGVQRVVPNGEEVKRLRSELNLSQAKLLTRCVEVENSLPHSELSCGRSTLQSIEAGEQVLRESLECVAAALKVPYERLLSQGASDANAGEAAAANPGREIMQLLLSARYEATAGSARALLHAALDLAERWKDSGAGIKAILWRAQILGELALEEEMPSDRAKRWREALIILEQRAPSVEPAIAEEFATQAVRCFQDAYSSLPRKERFDFVERAVELIDLAMQNSPDQIKQARLLSRKSAALRMQAQSGRWFIRKKLLQESVDCAEFAVRQSRQPPIILEAAAAHWAVARIHSTDAAYIDHLRQAEAYFSEAEADGWETAGLAKARFYRLTFRPLDACEQFDRLAQDPLSKRRVLRDSYICGEACVSLWRNDYPQSVCERYCDLAESLLEEGIAAGCVTARQITSLASIKAIQRGAAAGETVLLDMQRQRKIFDWNQLITELSSPNKRHGLLDNAFVLGINQSAVWTRLGTFARMFLNNEESAERYYRAACVLNPKDVVAHTELSRLLIRRGSPNDLKEARRCLDTARQFSDRRFQWWRSVLKLLEEEEGLESVAIRRHVNRPGPGIALLRFSEVADRFKWLSTVPEPQKRATELIQLLYQLARLSFGVDIQEEISGVVQSSRQIRLLKHRGYTYIIGCKWDDRLATDAEVTRFRNMLKGRHHGIYVSMSGFADLATPNSAGQIVLTVDGDEVSDVVARHTMFDELLLRKRLFLEREGEPFHAIRPFDVVEVPEP